MRRKFSPLVVALVVWGLAPSASAQSLRILVEGDDQNAIDVETLRGELERDLGEEVAVDGESPRVLHIRVGADGTIELVFRDGERERVRRAELPPDRDESLRVLVLLGSNLVRDPTDSLIEEPVAPPPARRAERAPPPVQPPRAPNLALERPFYFGLGGFIGLAGASVHFSPDGEAATVVSAPVPFYLIGGRLSYTVADGIAIGFSDLTFGIGTYGGYVGITPMLELSAFIDPRVQVYAQLGPSLEGGWGLGGPPGPEFGAALSVRGGVRFWVADSFSLGVEAGVHFVLTDYFGVGGAVLTQFSLPGTVGVNLGWHIL